jgi:transcriptional regulator with XRE-family HTH domain
MLIKRRRQQMGFRSQEALAARLGVGRTSVANWESGKHYPDRWLGALEAVLDISLGTDDVTPPPPADPADRELYDRLLREIEGMTHAEALGLIDRRRREGRRTA